MKLFENVHYPSAALELLAANGIQFDRAIHHPPSNELYGEKRISKHTGFHIYFMMGECDVAYYTPAMQSLLIHEKPRQWGAETLADYEIYPIGGWMVS